MTLGAPVLLDTNLLSETSRKQPDSAVAAYLADLDAGQTSIGAVSGAELERGINLLREREAVRSQRLRGWLEGQVLPRFEGRILSLDLNVAREGAA